MRGLFLILVLILPLAAEAQFRRIRSVTCEAPGTAGLELEFNTLMPESPLKFILNGRPASVGRASNSGGVHVFLGRTEEGSFTLILPGSSTFRTEVQIGTQKYEFSCTSAVRYPAVPATMIAPINVVDSVDREVKDVPAESERPRAPSSGGAGRR
jgi:hypothetical protein